jgi:hypothetical protein
LRSAQCAHRERGGHASEQQTNPVLPKTAPNRIPQTTVNTVERIANINARHFGPLWCSFVFCQAIEEDCNRAPRQKIFRALNHSPKLAESRARPATAMKAKGLARVEFLLTARTRPHIAVLEPRAH